MMRCIEHRRPPPMPRRNRFAPAPPVAPPAPKEMYVVLPHFSGDLWLLEKNLNWYKELDGKLNYDCILAHDNQTNDASVLPLAKEIFRSVEEMVYPRINNPKWPFNQNNAFMNVAWSMLRKQRPWFWCETDCVPLKPGWLDVLQEEYRKGGKPFGGHWNAEMKVFNGVAIYPHNVADYSAKMMQAALVKDMRQPDYQPPWDYYGSSEALPNMHIMNNVMQHIWEFDGKSTFPDKATVEKWLRPEVVLFHRCKDGSLIDRIRESNVIVPHGTDNVHPDRIMNNVDIFIVTFARDVQFLNYCLLSIRKFATGFANIIVLYPARDRKQFAYYVRKFPEVKFITFNEVDGKGMMHHEALICSADLHCPSNYILHMDSDCIFKAPVRPDDYFVTGKPVLLKERFDFIANGFATCPVYKWQEAVQNALGFKPEYETMRRHPAVHPRWIYQKVRDAVEQHTKKPFLEYVLSCRNEYPQGFAEFPTLGAWALRDAPDAYHWIDCEKERDKVPADKLYQFWSHGGLDFRFDAGPHVGKTAMDVINATLK